MLEVVVKIGSFLLDFLVILQSQYQNLEHDSTRTPEVLAYSIATTLLAERIKT